MANDKQYLIPGYGYIDAKNEGEQWLIPGLGYTTESEALPTTTNLVYTSTQQSRPSYTEGFARNQSESANPNLWDGLVGAWCPSLGPTGTTLRDISNNHRHGAFTYMDGSNWGISKNGYVLDYDGSSDYIGVSNFTYAFTDQITISAWMKPSVITGDNRQWIATNNTYFMSYIMGSNAEIQFRLNTGSETTLDSNSAMSLDVWQYVTLVYDGSNMFIYVDTDLWGHIAKTGNIQSITRLTIGAGDNGWADWFNGHMGDILIYNRALSSSEIQQLYVDPQALLRRQYLYPFGTAVAGGTRPQNPFKHPFIGALGGPI